MKIIQMFHFLSEVIENIAIYFICSFQNLMVHLYIESMKLGVSYATDCDEQKCLQVTLQDISPIVSKNCSISLWIRSFLSHIKSTVSASKNNQVSIS